MQVRAISRIEDLESLVPDWRRLAADLPLAGPDWLVTWWRHFGADRVHRSRDARLLVLAVRDDDGQLVALAPWYLESSRLHGRMVRFLGSGLVCTDYLTLPCASGQEAAVARAIAAWLCESGEGVAEWDLLSLENVDLSDPVLRELVDALCEREAITHLRPGSACWRLELPADWEAVLAGQSKSHRKQLRRLLRVYPLHERVRFKTVETHDEWVESFALLVDLHNRRWGERGIEGVFASPELYGFHREATERLLNSGQLALNVLEVDGKPVHADYALAGGKLIYAYQSGMDPAAADHEPGTLAMACGVQDAIARGYRAIDLLRGNEPYKQHWRATPRPMHDVRILPGAWSGRLRQSIWQAATGAKDWLRASRDAMFGSTAEAEF